jgi:hypothetical protein
MGDGVRAERGVHDMEHALRAHVLGYAAEHDVYCHFVRDESLNIAVDPRRRQPHPNPNIPAYGTLRDGGVRVSAVA